MLNVAFLHTWSGRFKMAEWVIILLMVLILRFTTFGMFALPGIDAALITYGREQRRRAIIAFEFIYLNLNFL